MLGNALGIDLGQIVSTASAVKTAQLNNQYRQMQIEWAKQDRLFQQEQFKKVQNIVKQKADKGELPAWMAGLGTKNISAILTLQSYMDKKKQEEWQKSMNSWSAAILATMNSPTPEKTYQTIKAKLPDNIKRMVPDHYDPDILKYYLYQIVGSKKVLEENYAYKLGINKVNIEHRNKIREIQEAGKQQRFTNKEQTQNKLFLTQQEAALKGKTGLDNTTIKTIQNLVVKAITGYTQIGAFSNLTLTGDQQQKITQTIEKAAELLRNGEARDAEEAVKIALQELKNPQKTQTNSKTQTNNDPAKIRNEIEKIMGKRQNQ